MRYRDLLEQLTQLTEEQLQQDVVIFDHTLQEYLPLNQTAVTVETDVLDSNHFYLEVST